MAMQIPVRRLVVDLDITHPQRSVDLHLCVKEVRAGIVVMQTRVYHFDVLTIGCFQFLEREHTVFPHILE